LTANRPVGTRAVILGNGPSVDSMPPEFWGRCLEDDATLLVGTNRALCMAAVQGVRLDACVIRDDYRKMFAVDGLGWQYHRDYWKPFDGWTVGPATHRVTHCDEFVRFLHGWQVERVEDANYEAAVLIADTVVLIAANWAWHQGCRDIAILGMDYSPGCAVLAPEYQQAPQRWADQYEKPIKPAIIKQTQQARETVESQGGRLVNLSEQSTLDALPKVTYDRWL